MSLLKEIDIQEILHSSRMGLWRVELEDGQQDSMPMQLWIS